MMDVKHTPGPWVVDDTNTTYVARHIDGAYHYICAVEPHDFSTDNPSLEERESNARLIAAAPDLLEALQGVVRVADRATVEFDAARAAIARATTPAGH